LDEGHDRLVEECFGQENQEQRKKRGAQRKRQRREEDAEYGGSDLDEGSKTQPRERNGGNDAKEMEEAEATPLRRSRRLRGEKVAEAD
jgi:hypothetical protein